MASNGCQFAGNLHLAGISAKSHRETGGEAADGRQAKEPQ